MSDTPRTYNVLSKTTVWGSSCGAALVEHARTLERELAAAQKDAQRYRWFREAHGTEFIISFYDPTDNVIGAFSDEIKSADELDAAIDAAISRTNHEPKDNS